MSKRLLSVLLLSSALPLAAFSSAAVAQVPSGEPGTTITNPGAAADQNAPAAPAGQDAPHSMDHASAPDATTAGPFVTVPEHGAWRVSDLEGKQVYGTDGENIGSISDVLVSQDGSVNAVIIGVGGFLGIGEKDVAVDMSALELGPGASQAEADAASAASAPAASAPAAGAPSEPGDVPRDVSGGTAATTGSAGNSGNSGNAGDSEAITIGTDGLPDRIVLNVTREQLQEAPAFEGVRAAAQPEN